VSPELASLSVVDAQGATRLSAEKCLGLVLARSEVWGKPRELVLADMLALCAEYDGHPFEPFLSDSGVDLIQGLMLKALAVDHSDFVHVDSFVIRELIQIRFVNRKLLSTVGDHEHAKHYQAFS
jgi:hypothetical protein